MKTKQEITKEVEKEYQNDWIKFCKERNLNPKLEPKSKWFNIDEELVQMRKEVDKRLLDQLEDGEDTYNEDIEF